MLPLPSKVCRIFECHLKVSDQSETRFNEYEIKSNPITGLVRSWGFQEV